MGAWLNRWSLYFAWVGSLFGTLMSLFFSEILYFEPCNLCWYQRICLFPLAIILGIAAYRSDRGIVRYTLPLVIIGALFALYQTAEQIIPGFTPIDLCGAGPRCDEDPLLLFGFISISMLSLMGFIAIGVLLLMAKPHDPVNKTSG
jgi:disulfide bond formation protein DsbB